MRQNLLLAATCASVLMLSTLQAHASPSEDKFDIVMVAMSPATWESIRYNTETGEAWIAQAGQWVAIEDKSDIPRGKYVIKMVGLSNDWSAIRFEVRTGQSWQCKEGHWVEMPHATQNPDDEFTNGTPKDVEINKPGN